MKIIFRNHELEDLANGIGDYMYPLWIAKKYRSILHEISKMDSVREIFGKISWLAEWKKWDRSDQIWIRINKWWRLMLKVKWNDVVVIFVREVTNHYW